MKFYDFFEEFFIIRKLLLYFILILSLISCGKKDSTNILSESNPILDGKKLTTPIPELTTNDNYGIKIDKKAFHHHFLMTAAYMGPRTSKGPYAFESKIVFFKLAKDSVQLIEVNAKNPLLAEFPIIHKNKDSVIFDFDKGMKHIFERKSTHSYRNHTNGVSKFDILKSFLYQAQIKNKHLIIKHNVKTEISDHHGRSSTYIFHMKYTFKSYVENLHFTPVIHPNHRQFAFSETHPTNNQKYVTRYDTTKPILFHYKGNIPLEYLDALKEGVLYWNKILGKEIVKLEKAPNNIEPFDPEINLIEWTEENINYAYTSILVDPFTGEIIQSYINFPSPLNSPRYNLITGYIKEHTHKILKGQTPEVKMANFNKALVDHQDIEHDQNNQQLDLKSILSSLGDKTSEQEIIKTIFADIIRSLIAHEVGHALGIKHNFAASVDTNFKIKQKNQTYYQYVMSNYLDPELSPASSVMDYLPFMFLAISGSQIQKENLNYSWDKKSISFLYGNQEDANQELYFCSDQDLKEKKWLNCKAFDSFKSPIIGSLSSLDDNLKIIGFEIAEKITNISSETIEAMPIFKLMHILNPNDFATKLFSYYKSIADNFNTKAKFIQSDSAETFQTSGLNQIDTTLEDILLSPFVLKKRKYLSPDSEFISDFIYKLKRYVTTQVFVLTKDEERDLNFLVKLDPFYDEIEYLFLNLYLNYLNTNQFNNLFTGPEELDSFINKLNQFTQSILFSPGRYKFDSTSGLSIPKFYKYGHFFKTPRDKVMNLTFHNLFPNTLGFAEKLSLIHQNSYVRFKRHITPIKEANINSDFLKEFNTFIKLEFQLFRKIIKLFEESTDEIQD